MDTIMVWVVVSFPAENVEGEINFTWYDTDQEKRARLRMMRLYGSGIEDGNPLVVRLVLVTIPDGTNNQIWEYLGDRLEVIADTLIAVAQLVPLNTHKDIAPSGGTFSKSPPAPEGSLDPPF